MLTGGGSLPSPPTPPAASSPTSSCAAEDAREPKTASTAAPRTASCANLHTLNQNHIWCASVTFAAEIAAWMQLLALSGTNARRWEPKRLRLFTIAATLTRHGRVAVLTLNQKHPWATLDHAAITVLRVAPAPG
jgi:hypothetical protein